MSSLYIVITLIGILCVLFVGIVVFLTIGIHLNYARWKNSKQKWQEKYDRKVSHYKCIRRIVVWLLAVCIVAEAIFFKLALTDTAGSDVTTDNPTVETRMVRNDPKDRLSQKEEEKIKTIFNDHLFLPWYEAEEGRTKEKYVEKVSRLFDGKEPVADALVENLEGKDKDIYAAYVKKQNEIDLKKVPEGATLEQVWKGEVPPERLTVADYEKEYELWNRRCELCPAAACQQQMGRSAVDVQTTMMQYQEYKDDWEAIIEYAMWGIQAYLALMFYVSADESKADCCYWIAKVFLDLAEWLSSMPAKFAEAAGYAEHCYLMAYAFAEVGLTYEGVGQQMDDHIADMTGIRDKADKALGK